MMTNDENARPFVCTSRFHSRRTPNKEVAVGDRLALGDITTSDIPEFSSTLIEERHPKATISDPTAAAVAFRAAFSTRRKDLNALPELPPDCKPSVWDFGAKAETKPIAVVSQCKEVVMEAVPTETPPAATADEFGPQKQLQQQQRLTFTALRQVPNESSQPRKRKADKAVVRQLKQAAVVAPWLTEVCQPENYFASSGAAFAAISTISSSSPTNTAIATATIAAEEKEARPTTSAPLVLPPRSVVACTSAYPAGQGALARNSKRPSTKASRRVGGHLPPAHAPSQRWLRRIHRRVERQARWQDTQAWVAERCWEALALRATAAAASGCLAFPTTTTAGNVAKKRKVQLL